MYSFLQDFWLCFIPLFVAVDAIGTLPIFISLIGCAEQKQVNRVVKSSVLTALSVAVVFVFLGELALRLLGITLADFMIAGGIVLLLLSIRDLLSDVKHPAAGNIENLGPVPLGVPLIVGPAVLTTIMLLVHQYGPAATTAATVINVGIAGVVFVFSGKILRVIGATGTRIVSKIANLFLAAIAIMLIRKGILDILKTSLSG